MTPPLPVEGLSYKGGMTPPLPVEVSDRVNRDFPGTLVAQTRKACLPKTL